MDNIQVPILLAFIACITYRTHVAGKTWYDGRKEKCPSPKVYDVGHKYIPDLSHNEPLRLVHDVLLPLGSVATMSLCGALKEYGEMWLSFFVIRAILISLTILPKHKHCDDTKLGILELIQGHCYDKIPSGHFATVFLAVLILLSKNVIGIPAAVALSGSAAWLILALRGHYSVDVAVSAIITFMLFELHR